MGRTKVNTKVSEEPETKENLKLREKKVVTNFIRFLNHFATLRVKLILAFMVPVVFIIWLGVSSSGNATQGLKTSYEQSSTQAINMTSDYLQFGFVNAESQATQYIKDETMKNYFMGNLESDQKESNKIYRQIRNVLLAKQTTDDFIADIYIFADAVKPVTTKKKDVSFSCADFFQTDFGRIVRENSNKGKWTGSDQLLDEKLGKDYAIRYVRKLTGIDGILVIDIDSKTIARILGNLEFGGTSIVGIVTPYGKEIISGTGAESGKPVFTDKEYFTSIAESKEMKGSDSVDDNGQKSLFTYSKLGESGATVCALIPEKTFVSRADKIKRQTLIMVLAACFIAVFVALLISFDIDTAIKRIIAGLKRAAKGDMTVEFSSRRKDEFHVLNEEIQNTFTNVKGLILQVKQLSQEVSGSSANVARTSETFLQASENISLAMNEIEQGVNQQSNDAEQCLNQMDNLSKRITVVSDNTKEISKLAEDTKLSVTDGTVVTQDLNKQTKATMDITTEIINEIEELEKKSKTISAIINVINEISNQTNLLSLNASIEASRAGEAGRGFAVVANEIRKLAEQSRHSASEIQKIVVNIQDGTKNAVVIAKKAENVVQLQENAVENTTRSYNRINQNVEQLVVNLNGILENIDDIEQARSTTLGSIENMSAVLEEIAASSNTVSQTAYNQLKTVETLNESAGSLNGNSEQLVKAVDAFTV